MVDLDIVSEYNNSLETKDKIIEQLLDHFIDNSLEDHAAIDFLKKFKHFQDTHLTYSRHIFQARHVPIYFSKVLDLYYRFPEEPFLQTLLDKMIDDFSYLYSAENNNYHFPRPLDIHPQCYLKIIKDKFDLYQINSHPIVLAYERIQHLISDLHEEKLSEDEFITQWYIFKVSVPSLREPLKTSYIQFNGFEPIDTNSHTHDSADPHLQKILTNIDDIYLTQLKYLRAEISTNFFLLFIENPSLCQKLYEQENIPLFFHLYDWLPPNISFSLLTHFKQEHIDILLLHQKNVRYNFFIHHLFAFKEIPHNLFNHYSFNYIHLTKKGYLFDPLFSTLKTPSLSLFWEKEKERFKDDTEFCDYIENLRKNLTYYDLNISLKENDFSSKPKL